MHITRLEIKNIPPLGEVSLHCEERVNLFIGPNASGKSTILRQIKDLQSKYVKLDPIKIEENRYVYVNHWGRGKFSCEALYDKSQDTSNPVDAIRDATCLLYIPATRVNLPAKDIYYGVIERPASYELYETPDDIFTRHFVNSDGAFAGIYVEDVINTARGEIITNRNQQNQFRIALESGYSCAKSICPEVVHDDVPHTYVEVIDDEYYFPGEIPPTERVVHYGMGVGTSDDILAEPLYAGDLSSGTQGTLLWIYALALKMAHHYGWEPGWDKKPAILLIDEIENHLHPTWQRRVIPALLDRFPGLQIFATTHSPFVVAGLKAGQVHLLRRDEDGVVTATTNTEDVVGWTADEILRTMMGVEDPTDAETAAAARELRQLRNEDPRSDPAEEEHRQKRMQELRQLVNRDLLAGGPWKKQRELFEEQFAEALKKYQQSQDLNQETR